VPGASYFFTVTLKDRSATTLLDKVALLRACVAQAKDQHPFRIDAMVVLPEHIHAIWTLPEEDSNYALRWMLIKRSFSRRVGRSPWQDRYWEHMIRDDRDFERHVEYIHFNPVKHGLVQRAADWPHSSVHRYIRQGLVVPDWGLASSPQGRFGE
jgi:putative transposase